MQPRRSDILIGPDELADAMESARSGGRQVRLLDIRWTPARPDRRPDYLAGHIPTAVYVDLDAQLANVGDPRDGRHPLPLPERLQADARAWGIDDGDLVVVYDDHGNLFSARAWWLLRHAGFDGVRMLDGGLQAWSGSGRPLEAGEVRVAPGSVSLAFGRMAVVSMDEAAEAARAGVLLDARAGERYRGESEPIDPRAGHIPGALSTPTSENLDERGRFRDAKELRRRFEAVGASSGESVVTYCGSGVTAAHNVAALLLAGYQPALYPGSWSQWSRHPDRPVAVGDAPGVLPVE